MAYKIEICGNLNMAGSDAQALERLENREFASEKLANEAVDALAASWVKPQGVWDIVAVVEAA